MKDVIHGVDYNIYGVKDIIHGVEDIIYGVMDVFHVVTDIMVTEDIRRHFKLKISYSHEGEQDFFSPVH